MRSLLASPLVAIVALVSACGGASADSDSGTLDATTDGPGQEQGQGDDGGTDANDGAVGSTNDAISIQPPQDDADTPSSPDAGPGGPWVAFVSNRAGDFDIYLVHPDGTELHPLVSGAGSDLFPSWSPDGARLAFASTRGSDAGGYSLYVVDVASGAISPIPNQLTDAVSPAWSPDGATFAIGGPGGLYTLPAAGGTATPLTTGSFRDNSPAWAPNGSVVYFSSDRATTFDTWSVQPDGGSIQQVTTGTGILGGPAVSPDGATIAFTGGASDTQVSFFTLATKGTALFSAMGDSEPAFSPSGTQLALTSTRYAADNAEIVLVGIPGASNPFRLTNSPGVDGQAVFQPGH